MRGAVIGLLIAAAVACAPKAAPVVTGAPRHPDFIFPASPEGTPADLTALIDRGWQYLQADDVRSAQREFTAVLSRRTGFAPAETAMAYAELAKNSEQAAVERFDRAIKSEGRYVPALIGRGQALLELGRDTDALVSLEAALAADPSLTVLRPRVDVLRFRATQAMLERAKSAANAGRMDEARSVYEQAIAASPDSAFLYRELAAVEQRAGRLDRALEGYQKAAQLDPTDARSLAAAASILEEQGDIIAALASYERARNLDASEVSDADLARIRGKAALTTLPEPYRAIPSSSGITKGDMAALIGVRLESLVVRARPSQIIITDIRGHWAERWITAVVRAGIMETLANYQFQPASRVRRGDLALIISRVLTLIASVRPDVAARWKGAMVRISDVPAGHLSYPAVSAAVASGVMPLEAGAFQLLRVVTGAEALDVTARLEALTRP
ncbi:MAG: tetratricopeptide repeat protein [Vicinamibacterales bacterium]